MARMLRWAALLALLLGSFALGYGLPGGAHASAGVNPLLSIVQSATDKQPLVGRVEQQLRAGGYTYLAVRTEQDALHWAVTLGKGAPPGTRVSVRSLGHRASFTSRRLGRTFEQLRFGIVTRLEGEDP